MAPRKGLSLAAGLIALVGLLIWLGGGGTTSRAPEGPKTSERVRVEDQGVPQGRLNSARAEVLAEQPEAKLVEVGTPKFTIRVEGPTFDPVHGATVFFYSNGVTIELGVTQADGTVECDMPESAGSVYAVAAGMVSETRRLSSAVDQILVVRLSEAGWIAGDVYSSSGLPAPEGTMVLLWRGSQGALPEDTVASALAGDPGYKVVATDSAGHFLAANLQADVDYSICAGGGGELCATPIHRIRTGSGSNLLRMERVYLAEVHLVDQFDQTISAPRALATQCRLRTEFQTNSPANTALASWVLPLAGVDFSDPAEAELTLRLAYSAQSAEAQIGPILLSAQIPGYDKLEADIFLEASYGGPAPTLRLRMEGGAEYPGSIIVSLVNTEHLADRFASNRVEDVGTIYVASSAKRLKYSFESFGAQEIHIENLPPGRYQLRYGAQVTGEFLPLNDGSLLTVDVGDGESSLELDCSELSTVAFDVGVGSASYDGPLAILLERHGGVRRMVHFSHAPYEIPGFVEGDYSARVHLPTGRRGEEMKDFTVEKGGSLRVVLE